MSTAEEATTATETITVTTVTVTEPTTTTTTQKNSVLVYRVNRKIDKNDPDRFKGEGISFNAKLIGVEEVPEARGDKMCQEKIYKLKGEVKTAGVHKQKIIINVSEEGIKIVDVRHGVVEHSHPVHKVSFISRDMNDSRAFGYIYSTEEKKHHFFAIKTEKSAEAVVLTLRDLFQIIFERKKKEMEEAKKTQVDEKKEEKPDPNVIKLDGELNTESNTDEEPVYSVPQNNKPVKERAGSSLVDLESELETIGQIPETHSEMPGETINLFLRGLEGRLHTIEIDSKATISDLFKKVEEYTDMEKDDVRVLYGAKDLRITGPRGQQMSIEDYDIPNNGNLTLVCRVRGGSDEPPVLKVYGDDVQLTSEPDMFTLDDDEGGQRAKMPCGHAISPESLTAFCRSLLTAGKYEFRCPYKKSASDPMCGQQWELYIVRKLAILTEDERKEFEIKISENYLRKAAGMQECPKCLTYCERRRKSDIRVICPICSKKGNGLYEFCWYCLKTWLGSGTKECGNMSCSGEDPRLRILKSCPMKSVVEVPNCPAVRACPTCGLLIEHIAACKQMVCPCGQKFCFICLKIANASGQYQCGAFNFKCQVAPVQSTLPGDS